MPLSALTVPVALLLLASLTSASPEAAQMAQLEEEASESIKAVYFYSTKGGTGGRDRTDLVQFSQEGAGRAKCQESQWKSNLMGTSSHHISDFVIF